MHATVPLMCNNRTASSNKPMSFSRSGTASPPFQHCQQVFKLYAESDELDSRMTHRYPSRTSAISTVGIKVGTNLRTTSR